MLHNLYFDMFVDSFSASIFLMMMRDIMYPAMVAIGTYPLMMVSVLALIATTLGNAANWMIGSLVATLKKQTAQQQGKVEVDGWFGKAMKYAQRYGIWLLLFNWVDIFGGMLALFAGVFGVRFWPAMAVVILGRVLFLIYMATLW